MKKTILAAALLSLSAPLAIAHENHDHGDDSPMVKPQQAVRKAKAAKPAADEAKQAEQPAAEKADESVPPAPKKK